METEKEVVWGDDSTWGKKPVRRGITWNKKRKDPVLLRDLPSDKEVLMDASASPQAVSVSMRRCLLELMDMHEELHQAFERFGM